MSQGVLRKTPCALWEMFIVTFVPRSRIPGTLLSLSLPHWLVDCEHILSGIACSCDLPNDWFREWDLNYFAILVGRFVGPNQTSDCSSSCCHMHVPLRYTDTVAELDRTIVAGKWCSWPTLSVIVELLGKTISASGPSIPSPKAARNLQFGFSKDDIISTPSYNGLDLWLAAIFFQYEHISHVHLSCQVGSHKEKSVE